MTMKSSILNKTINAAVLAATMLVSVLGFGQDESTQYKASIPFQFQLAGKVLPAGEYVVKLTDHFVQIRPANSAKGVGIATLKAERKETAAKDVLQFNVYGDQYFLSQLWFHGSEIGRSVVTSKAEMQVARQVRENRVELALKK
jgi:hypothetical protein